MLGDVVAAAGEVEGRALDQAGGEHVGADQRHRLRAVGLGDGGADHQAGAAEGGDAVTPGEGGRVVEGPGRLALQVDRELADRIDPELQCAIVDALRLERPGGEGEMSGALTARPVEQRHVEEGQVQEIAVIRHRAVRLGLVEAAGDIPGELGGEEGHGAVLRVGRGIVDLARRGASQQLE